MSTEADDRRELELLRITLAEERRANLLVEVERDDLAAEVARLRAKVAEQAKANQTLLVELARTTEQLGALVEENVDLRARVADNTTPASVLADVEELTARDGGDATARERAHWLNAAGAFGFDPTDIAGRDRKPRLRVVPGQRGAS